MTSAGSEGSTTAEESTGVTTTQPATTTMTTGPAPTSTTSPTAGSSGSSTESPTTGGVTCPNGIVEDDEACDDGNAVDGDGCNNDCTESGALLWEYKSGLPGTDEIRDIAIDANGGIIVVGEGLARFSAQLEPDWSQEHGSGPSDRLLGVVTTAGAIFAAGAIAGPEPTIRAAWTGRFTLAGELVWEDVWNHDLGTAYATQIARADDGELVIAGLMQLAADEFGVFARRYSADGEALWTSSHSVNANQSALWPLGPGLAVAPDAVYVGWTVSNEGVGEETLVAFPAGGGAALWARAVSDTSGSIQAIARDPGGELILGSNGDGFKEMTARRVTSAGDPVWSSAACIGDIARDIAIDGSGDVIVIGDGLGDSHKNIRLCKFAPDGTLRWGRDIDGGGGGIDLGYAVAVLPSNRIVAGGSVYAGANLFDAWLGVYSP